MMKATYMINAKARPRTKRLNSGFACTMVAAALATTALVSPPAAYAAPSAASNGRVITLSIGRGQQINLPSAATDVM